MMLTPLCRGDWARVSPLASDAGRIVRLRSFQSRTEAWVCDVVDPMTGRRLYTIDVRAELLTPVTETSEPLLFLALESLAGPFDPSS